MAIAPRRGRNKPKTRLGRMWATLFCKRSIIIISDQHTQHVPFSSGIQALAAFGAFAFVVWASFSSGSYMAAQRVIDEKEQKLATFASENERVSAEFTLLKQDLQKLADGGKGTKTAEAAKEIVAQYEGKGETHAVDLDATKRYDAVFSRIQFLENKVKDLQSTHDQMISDIRATTGGKIKELEKVIARTGVNGEELTRAAELKRQQEEDQHAKYERIEKDATKVKPTGGQGGPFEPAPAGSLLKEKETELYFSLRHLGALNEVVTAMPLDLPLANNNYRTNSGFGTRVDPFRGTLAFHAGVDLAGPHDAKIVASQAGRVEFAGWKTAYGNVVELTHELGFSTRYGHLKQILVRPGQLIKKGQVIAIQGSTGRSTGEHLHYEVRYDDKPINPVNFLKAGEDVRAD